MNIEKRNLPEEYVVSAESANEVTVTHVADKNYICLRLAEGKLHAFLKMGAPFQDNWTYDAHFPTAQDAWDAGMARLAIGAWE